MIDPTLPTAYGPVPGAPINPLYRPPGQPDPPARYLKPGICGCPECVKVRAANDQLEVDPGASHTYPKAEVLPIVICHTCNDECEPGAPGPYCCEACQPDLPANYDPGNDLSEIANALPRAEPAFVRIQQHIISLLNRLNPDP